MAWFRTARRYIFGSHGDPRAWKRFDALNVTTTDLVVYHGDSRPWADIVAAQGLKRYIPAPAMPKPLIMDAGGTRNTVTTTMHPDVAASYATRGAAMHVGAVGPNRYIYAIFLPVGRGVPLSQLPPGLGPGQLSPNNARSLEVLVTDVPLANILGYRPVHSARAPGPLAMPSGPYVAHTVLPPATTIPAATMLLFQQFIVAVSYNIIAV